MKIAVIGAGRLGSAVGTSLAKHNHEVVFGVRDTKNHDSSTAARFAPVMEAAQSSDIVVLAVPAKTVRDAVPSLGDLKDKILVDATNPFLSDLSGIDPSTGSSQGELVASFAPGALVVKAFNTTGSGNVSNPDYNGQKPTMLYCGDDDGAKRIVADLIVQLGFDPVDAGPLSRSHILETFSLLWVTLAFKQGFGPNFALKLMRR